MFCRAIDFSNVALKIMLNILNKTFTCIDNEWYQKCKGNC